MKQSLYILILGAIIAVSCKKGSPGTTRLMVNNATFEVSALSAVWNNNKVTPTALSEGQNTGLTTPAYLQLPAGTNNIVLQSGSTSFLNKNIYAGVSTYYSLLVYDSSSNANSMNAVLLTDDLTLPDTAHANFRFINCVPDTAVDIVLINSRDTVPNTGISFIGATPYASNIELFTAIPYGTYKLYVFKTGSDSTGTATPILAPDSIRFGPQKIISLLYSGKPAGTGGAAIKLSVITHIAH